MLARIYWLQEPFSVSMGKILLLGQLVLQTERGSFVWIWWEDFGVWFTDTKWLLFGGKKVFFSELNCDTYSYNVDLVFLSPVQHWVLLSWRGYDFSFVWWCQWDCRLCLKNKRSVSPSQNPTYCIWRHKYAPEGTSPRQALAGTFFSGAAKAPFSYSWARWCLNLPTCCLWQQCHNLLVLGLAD